VFDVLTIDDFLSPAETAAIAAELRAAEREAATVYGATGAGAAVVPQSRRTSRVIASAATRALIIERLISIRDRLASHFDAALGEVEEPQFLRYDVGDYFVAHQDGNTPTLRDDSRFRRVSVIVFLTDPAAYDGGVLQLHGAYPNYTARHPIVPTPGALVAFRSETTHEVTPLIAGERYTIVSWFRAA